MSLGKTLNALLQKSAATSPDAADPRLRGRTYAVPFDRVWTEAIALTGARLDNWSLLHADDFDGVIRAEATARLFRSTADISIRIVLDENAQTRVDAEAVNRSGKIDLGASARHLIRFFRALDAALAAEPERGEKGAPARGGKPA